MLDQGRYLIITNLTTLASPQHLPSQILSSLQAGIPSETASHTSTQQANWSKQPVAVEVPFHFYHLPLLDPWLISYVPLSHEHRMTKGKRTGGTGSQSPGGKPPSEQSIPEYPRGKDFMLTGLSTSPQHRGSFSKAQPVGRSQSAILG